MSLGTEGLGTEDARGVERHQLVAGEQQEAVPQVEAGVHPQAESTWHGDVCRFEETLSALGIRVQGKIRRGFQHSSLHPFR